MFGNSVEDEWNLKFKEEMMQGCGGNKKNPLTQNGKRIF